MTASVSQMRDSRNVLQVGPLVDLIWEKIQFSLLVHQHQHKSHLGRGRGGIIASFNLGFSLGLLLVVLQPLLLWFECE